MSETEPLQLHVVHDDESRPAERWEDIYRREVDLIFRFIHVRTGNRADAEDICAQVFLRALPRLQAGAEGHSIHSYLLATARTALADHWADRFKVPVTSLPDEFLPPALREEAPGRDHGDRVRLVLSRLPERERKLLELRFLRGYSVKEAAAALGVSIANCKVIQLRALRRAAALDGGAS